MVIRAIIFDLAGTYITHTYPAVFKAASAYYGVPARTMGPVLEAGLDDYFRGKINEYTYWRRIEKKLKLPKKTVKRFWSLLYLKHTRVDPKMRALAQKLKKKGYKIGVLSNTARSHVVDNRKKKRVAIFDRYVYSNEVGVLKPHPKLYRLIVKKLRVKPEECIFIDDVKRYLTPAKKMGMRVVHHTIAAKTAREVLRLL